MSIYKKILLLVFILFWVAITYGFNFDVDSLSAIQGLDAKADSFEYIGDNMVAYGNIFVRKGDLTFYADKAIVNNTNKNIELSGNVRFFKTVRERQEIEYWDLKNFEKNPNMKIKVVGTVMTPTGRQKLIVDTITESLSWQGDRAVGNLTTGVFEFGSFSANFGGWTVTAQNATRKADGEVVVKDATASPSPDFSEGHSVFSVKSGKITAFPSGDVDKSQINSPDKAQSDFNQYHYWAYDNVFYIGNVPVMWLPIMYKPPPNRNGMWTVTSGSSSDLGTYIKTTNNWTLWDEPDLNIATSNLVDYYSRRGLGYGNATTVATPNSLTQSFAYGINDKDPDYSLPNNSRFDPLSPYRYNLDLKNITHIDDRLDFRGRFSKVSDFYFNNDYFNNFFSQDPYPASWANLDYQTNWSSISLNVRPQVNTWENTSEQLPNLLLTVPRQEIFDNFYYQGEHQIGYLDQRWMQFQQSRYNMGLGNGVEPAGYGAGRFDTVNFAYYPINMDLATLIPRAGFRFTAYSAHSTQNVSDDDLNNIIGVSQPESWSPENITNYNTNGGAAGRLLPEVGMNLNTKLSQSWGDVKNAFWNIDGIRHVATPYLDYTYLQPTGMDRENTLYFDDIDRITTQNFLRGGIDNRLQTRRGDWKTSQVYTWAQMHNYLDFLFNTDSRQDEPSGTIKNLGDWGNIITISPTESLSFTAQILLDAGRLASGQDLGSSFTTSNLGYAWTFADGWNLNGNYYYSGNNNTSSTYSMGDTLQQVQSGSFFQRSFTNSSYLNQGMNFKINDRTTGNIYLMYDFYNSLMPGLGVSITRDLPCGLQVVFNASTSESPSSNGSGSQSSHNVSASLQMTSNMNYEITPRNDKVLPFDQNTNQPYFY